MSKSRSVKAGGGGTETVYSGVTFRSRLEARWAIFFDLLDWDWDYEPCSYKVGARMEYLPDFYLPTIDLWVEVKGPFFLSGRSISKYARAVAGPMPIPRRTPPHGPAGRLLIAGDLIAPTHKDSPRQTLLWNDGKGAAVSHCILGPDGPEKVSKPWRHLDARNVPLSSTPPRELSEALCTPGRRAGALDAKVAGAYVVASMPMKQGRNLVLDNQVASVLSHRRGGRPIR